uniref:Secreted protein n=1 Tax=Oryza sativa subsp. japonica TaxID=39947 RepID=Q8H678_ORYSJ|nr:hypothetical protein [Oryza sativa Japonica Group]BAD67771.1 hypothetical protein [Oryza sativa Japonica Group]
MEWRWPLAGLGGCRLGAAALAAGSVGRRDSGGDGSGMSGRRIYINFFQIIGRHETMSQLAIEIIHRALGVEI